jgi:hypothetical protein
LTLGEERKDIGLKQRVLEDAERERAFLAK